MAKTEEELKPAWADTDKRLGRVPQGIDRELHVREVKIENMTFVDIRDYIPSLKEYGKGALIRRNDLPNLLEILNQYADYHFGRTGKQTAGQQALPGME